MKQKDQILDYLKTNDHITAWIAMGVFRIMRLASRIEELRDDLWRHGDNKRIHSETLTDASGKRYVRYRLVGPSSARFMDVDGCCIKPTCERKRAA